MTTQADKTQADQNRTYEIVLAYILQSIAVADLPGARTQILAALPTNVSAETRDLMRTTVATFVRSSLMGVWVQNLWHHGSCGPQWAFARNIFELNRESPCCTALVGAGQFSAQIKGRYRMMATRVFSRDSGIFFLGVTR
jgi:hypothetical protein